MEIFGDYMYNCYYVLHDFHVQNFQRPEFKLALVYHNQTIESNMRETHRVGI